MPWERPALCLPGLEVLDGAMDIIGECLVWAGVPAPGPAGTIIDNRASDAQAEALSEIFRGKAGGWPEEFAKCLTQGREFLGTERAPFSFEVALDHSRSGFDIPG